MRKKKLCAVVAASSLVAAQMVMPVMAAGGSITTDVTTKTGLIRVVVPTSLPIAIDEFQMMTSGTQIHSEEFTMENKSELDVMIKITSTATLGTGVSLKDTKAAAQGSTGSDLWLAAAAKTGADTYDDPKTATPTETIATLAETNANVATLKGDDKKAEQTFYLKKSSPAYKLLNVNEDSTGIKYAEFYELTTITFSGTGDQDTLNAAIAAGDVYSVATTSIGDGAVLNKIEKGGSATFASTNTYYKVAATAAATIDNTKPYVYADGTADATDGKAAFRYIGTLGNKTGWTSGSGNDVQTVTIAYDITGVKQDIYTALKGTGASDTSLYYGLYVSAAPADAAPSIAVRTYNYDRTASLDITADLGAGDLAATSITKVEGSNDGTTVAIDFTSACTITGNKITFKNGQFAGASVGNKRYLIVTFNDDEATKVTLELNITK